jgi:uncharacterized protein (TIGR02996 family)
VDDRTALLNCVLNAPADDAARLVLADWLEEHGEEDFGRFLRAGVLASHYRSLDLLDDPAYYELLRTVSDIALGGGPARWLSELGVGPTPLTSKDWVWDHAGDRVVVRVGTVCGTFTRGMLSELALPLDGWCDFAAPALALRPLERVTITSVRGLGLWIDPPDDDHPQWRLTAAFTVQPRRQRGLLGQLGGLLVESDLPPVPVGRWTAERPFHDRAGLVRSFRDVAPQLLDEVRGQAGSLWELARRRA